MPRGLRAQSGEDERTHGCREGSSPARRVMEVDRRCRQYLPRSVLHEEVVVAVAAVGEDLLDRGHVKLQAERARQTRCTKS